MNALDITRKFYDFQRFSSAERPSSYAPVVIAKCDNVKYICKHMVDRYPSKSFVELHRAVSVLESPFDLHSLATHNVKLGKTIEGEEVEVMRRISKIKDVDTLEVLVVLQDVTKGVKCPKLLTSLLESSLIKSSCYIQLSQNPNAKAMNVHGVYIRGIVAGEELEHDDDTAFEIVPCTVLTITGTVSVERLRWLSKISTRDEIGGLNNQVNALKRKLRNRPKNGFRSILISGPSGCGKSTLIEKISSEERFLVRKIDFSLLTSAIPGNTEKELQKAFSEAESFSKEGPTVLVLENVDILCPPSTAQNHKSHEARIFEWLLFLLDDLHAKESRLVVITTTITPQRLGPRLRRPGRLTDEIIINVPTKSERIEILTTLRGLNKLDSEMIEHLSNWTPGYLGADLKLLIANIDYRVSVQREPLSIETLNSALREVPATGFRGGIGSVDVGKKTSWDDIGGLAEIKAQLQQAIEWPLLYPEAFVRMGLKRSKGCLLYGPPGCGKTKLVRTAASSTGATFLSVSAASIFSPYVGESEKAVSELFRKARMGAPTILFIDEIDSLVSARDGMKNGVSEKVLSTFLNEMDGFSSTTPSFHDKPSTQLVAKNNQSLMVRQPNSENDCNRFSSDIRDAFNNDVVVICATNRPECLDPALCRPGRLDSMIYVPPPDFESRVQILERATKNMKLNDDVSLQLLAQQTELFTGADLEHMCREAVLEALTTRGFECPSLRADDFEAVQKNLKSSIDDNMIRKYEQFQRT